MCCGDPVFPEKDSFPSAIQLHCQRFRSFDFTMEQDYVWNAIPRSNDDLLAIFNWAAKKEWVLRARGGTFTWFPGLVCDLKKANKKLLLIDMTAFMNFIDDPNADNMTVRCGAGANCGRILEKLDQHNLILSSYPADGDLSIGGCITAGSHGSVCTDVPNIGPNPHGSLANMVTEYVAVVWSKESNEYVIRTFDRSTPEGRAYLISFGRIFLVEVRVRVMKNYNCRCKTEVTKDFAKVFAKPTPENPTPEGSFAHRALTSGRYSALSMPLINTVWHRDVSPCAEKPETAKKIDKPYSFPYMANLPLWQQSLAQQGMGVPTDGLLQVLAEHFGPESHEGFPEKVADSVNEGINRFQEAFGIDDLLRATSKGTSYITKATIELSSWMHDLSDAWGKSQDIMLCVRDTLRMRSFGVVIITSRDKVQSCAAAAMAIIQGSLNEEAKKNSYPVALPVEFRASSLDDDVEGGAPMLSFIRKDPEVQANGWDVAIAIEVVHFPKTYGVNRYMAMLENALATCPELGGNKARVVANWGKSFAYSALGPWHSQQRLDVLRKQNPEWDQAVQLINSADPKNVTNNTICQYILQPSGSAPPSAAQTVDHPLPWDTKFGEDEPGCGKSCMRFWCCCCVE